MTEETDSRNIEDTTEPPSNASVSFSHDNIYNVTLQNDTETSEYKDIIDIVDDNDNTSDLERAKQKLQALLLDDFEQHSIERLEFLLTSIESGIRGSHTLISEDIIEFTTYLIIDNNNTDSNTNLSQKAIDMFIDRFDNKFETISKIGELRRPQIGDLLIDAFCDLVIIMCSEINNYNTDSNTYLQQHCISIITLIRITCKMCVLRHGFTRLFEMYSWLISQSKSSAKNKDPISPNSYPSSPSSNTKYKPSEWNMKLANIFLDVLTNCISLSGPEIYLSSYLSDNNNGNNKCGLRPMVHIKSRLSKGWSFTSWIRLHPDQKNGIYNILSFEGLFRICIEILTIGCKLKIELIEKNNSKFFILPDLNVSIHRWHFLCISHNISTKQDNFLIFIDGKCLENNKLSIPYPNFSTINNNGIFPLYIGGFLGDIGQSFIYETSLNNLTVSALYCVGATYSPPIYNRSGTANNYFDRIAAFPRSVRQRAAPMQPRKYGYLLLPFCYGLNPRAVNEILCLPSGWGYIDICDRKNNLNIVSIPHNKSSLISMGGICYIFYWLSPEFNGPNIYSDVQASCILSFINELITNNLTLLRQLFTMGLSAIKIYILRYIKYQYRTHLILNCIKELLMIITNCDQDSRKQYFIDGFINIILDINYWIKSPQTVQNMVAQYIHTLIQTQPKIMINCLSLTQIFDMIRAFYPNSFQIDIYSNNKVVNDTDSPHVANKLLDSAIALVRLKSDTVKYSSHRAISLLIYKCISKSLRCQLLTTYGEMCYNAPDIMFTQMAQKSGFIKVLWDILQEKKQNENENEKIITSNKILTDTRVKIAKILMGFIRNQRKLYSLATPTPVVVVSRSGHVNKSAQDELISEIGISLGLLAPSLASYSSLLEIILGKFKLNLSTIIIDDASYTIETLNENDNDENSYKNRPELFRAASLNMVPLVSDKDQISLVGALSGLMNLISFSSYRIRTRMLMDILSLVKTSDYNQKLFCRQKNSWDKWMVNLISLEINNDDASACNQLVSQIAATIVWRFLIKDDKGWISVMQLLESLNRRILDLIRAEKQQEQEQEEKSNNNNKISTETKLKCRILHEFLVQVLVLVLNRFLMDQLKTDMNDNGKPKKNQNKSSMNDLSDASDNIKSRTGKNLTSILDITEWLLFNHRFSMLSIPRIRLKQDAKESDITIGMLFDTPDSLIEYGGDEIRNEILLLKRLLSCSLKFISFKNERQLVLRRLLRYLKCILPHTGCNLVFDDVINAAREFCNRLQNDGKDGKKHKKKNTITSMRIKTENNMKTMRIAYSFLKNAYIRYKRRDFKTKNSNNQNIFKIRALQEEVYAFWGPLLFEDKIDPNTANQMNLPLEMAEDSLENNQHHIHSLWVFLQHQKWWEYQFQDKNMKKFKIEYSSHEKEDNKKKLISREQFDKYYQQCKLSYEQIYTTELSRINDSNNLKKRKKKENIRDLQKYMDFFDEDFQCRFPNDSTPQFWELDPRESSSNHTRMLLVRNFKGSNHLHAAVNNSKNSKTQTKETRVRSISNLKKRNSGPRARLLKQISTGIQKDLKMNLPENNPLMMSVESIAEDYISEDSKNNQNDLIDSGDDYSGDSSDDELIKNAYQSANLAGKKILIELDATSISPFFKISGKMFITEHHLIFEGHEYIENIHEQNAADQIKLTKQRIEREKKQIARDGHIGDESILQQLEIENKQQFAAILANKDTYIGTGIIEYEIWSLAHIKHLYPRRYLLRENGLEIWIAGTSRSFFFTFKNKRKRGDVISIILKHSPRFIKSNPHHSKDLLVNPLKMLKHIGLTEKWQKRKISNFDYLMELNVLAGRSYNDITQYPVFPWVITDFESSKINLNNRQIYRDLCKPIGALNGDRLQTYVQRYQDSLLDTSDSFPAFYYGSHYMSAGIALYYLCRMEPFATLYINLHGGRFEIPDRIFYSISNAWDLSLNNMGDVKELIPEIFYFPEFLRNINKFPLGCLTRDRDKNFENKNDINNVLLPPWANNSPEEFVRIMRLALESDYVSLNLHNWIDLIFGYKQRGEESVSAHNVFFYLTYAGAVDPDTISDPTIKAATEQQIYHFGQTPNILFHQPHPQRLKKNKCYWLCELSLPYKNMKTTLLPTKHSHMPQKSLSLDDILIKSNEEEEDDIINNQPFIICKFKFEECPSYISIIRNGQCLKIFDSTQRILSFELPMLCYLDPAQPNKSTQLRQLIDSAATQIPPDLAIFELMPPDWSDSLINNNNNTPVCVISSNGLYGITGGYLDCSIKVHWLKDGSTLASVTGLENGHNDIITCLALDYISQDMLISGSNDGSIVHWSSILKSAKPGRTPLIGKPYRLLSIHYDRVTNIAINSKVGIIISAANDSTIALYSIARKRFVRQLLFEGRDDATIYPYKILIIKISNNGYIIIHSLDTCDQIPYLRIMSINGILICKIKLNEILYQIKIDQTNKILICGGQLCKITFRYIHNLKIIQEIKIFENINLNKYLSKPSIIRNKKKKQKKNINSNIIKNSIILSPKINKNKISHSSAWRQKEEEEEKQNNNISRIIDFDLDPDNTYIIIVLSNRETSAKCVQLLLYPLPNTRHINQFDKFVLGSNKVLQTAKKTIWENIINVIQCDNPSSGIHTSYKDKLPDLYLQPHITSNPSKGGKLIIDTGKNILSKIKKTTDKLSQHNSNNNNSMNGSSNKHYANINNNNNNNDEKNNDNDDDDNNNHIHTDSSINKLGNAFKSFWKKQ